jgi:hypothetical protein
MLEYAYRLQSFQFLDGLVDSSFLEEIYDRLARILALKIQDCSTTIIYPGRIAS